MSCARDMRPALRVARACLDAAIIALEPIDCRLQMGGELVALRARMSVLIGDARKGEAAPADRGRP